MSKPIRTILCVPGHDLHKVERCRDFGADLILFDLEDSVPADKKALAREIVAAHARPGDAVRVEHYGKDHRPWKGAGVALWLPKLGADALLVALRATDEAYLPVVPIIETPAALAGLSLFMAHIGGRAKATSWCNGLAFGRADFMAAVGSRGSGWPIVDRAQEMVALAAHALDVPCYDSPCESRDLRDCAGAARRAVACCYTGMGCIYPEHIPIVREAYAPRQVDLDRAARIVAGAEQRGGELFEDCGAVVAPPHVKAAKELLSAFG